MPLTKITPANLHTTVQTMITTMVNEIAVDSASVAVLIDSSFDNIVGGTGITYTSASKTFDITNTGVSAGSYGSASLVPILTINAQGQVTSASTTSVAGVSSTSFDSASGIFTISTADGGSFNTTIADSDFTTKRARESISATGSLSYNSGTGVMSYTQGSTDTITEGSSNLYYTDTRSRSAISLGTAGSQAYNSTTGVFTIPGTTDHINEGSNLFYTNARADARVNLQTGSNLDLSSKSTSDLSEGTNLYYTTTRGDSDTASYISGNRTYGNITTTGYIAGPASFTIDPAAVGDNTGTVIIAGNLTVNGTTTTVNSTTVSVGDNILVLNADETGVPSQNAGIEIERGTSTNVQFIWDEANDRWSTVNQDLALANLVVNGTVDGRDVATDGTKLDGIESGATADQTASEILTAIKTVDGAGSNLDADLLDGQQGSYYLNTSTSFGGDVSGTYNAIVVADDSHTHDGRYYTETEADSRFVNVTGDTMTGPLIIDTNTSGMLVLSATNGSPWAIDLQRDDATNSRVFNSGGKWYFEHRPSFVGNTAFDDGYHPNADKWTTARTLSLSGDASGSVSWDGSANATLSVTVADDSHTHDGRYYTETEADSRFANVAGDTFTGLVNVQCNTDATGSSAPTYYNSNIELETSSNYTPSIGFHRGGYSAGVLYEYDGQIYSKAWVSRSQDGLLLSSGNIGSYAWTSSNDGSGSGLDADLLDGIQASSFLRSDASDTATGIITFQNASDFQIKLDGGSSTWAGILWEDVNGSDYMWYNGATSTWAIGGGGSQVSGKKLHVDGGMSVGANADATSTPTNGIYTEGAISVGGNTVWHAGNDGAGSGLDADTVDGIQASSFLRSDTDDTTSGVITFGPNPWWNKYLKIGGNADHSDANTASIGVTNGNLHIDAANGAFTTYLNFYDGTGGVAFGNGAVGTVAWMGPDGDLWKGSADNSGSKYWHAGNDGSGSGLDADTLDGIDSSSFLRSDAADTATGKINFYANNTNNWDTIATATGGLGAIEIFNDGVGNDAFMTFHVGNDFACYFGLDGGINDIAVGGWSFGANSYRIWHQGNDGSGSGLDADLLDGYNSAENGASVILRSASNGYLNLSNWVNIGASGIYSGSNTNGAHFYPNQTTPYGTWATSGSRSGFDGIMFDHGGDVAVMFDASGNGGFYRHGSSLWYQYYNLSNQCTGFNTSTTSSSYTIYVNGSLYATGSVFAASDARIKENVVTIDSALDKVNAMRGVYYNKIDDPEKTKEVGFIAQEVNEVLPEVVSYAEDVDEYGVKYGNVTALLVEAVKELSNQVKDLKAELEELKNA